MRSIPLRSLTVVAAISLTLSCHSSDSTVSDVLVLAAFTGNGQTATVGGTVTTAPAVKVTDNAGAPKSGVSVTFTIVNGSGSLTGGNADYRRRRRGNARRLDAWYDGGGKPAARERAGGLQPGDVHGDGHRGPGDDHHQSDQRCRVEHRWKWR